MQKLALFPLFTLFFSIACSTPALEKNKDVSAESLNIKNKSCQQFKHFTLVVHGGLGELSPLQRNKVQDILQQGYDLLKQGSPSLDVVESVVTLFEDSGLFNAGKGAVHLDVGGGVELDASIMNGKDLTAGAVAGVRLLKNPIQVARKVMEKTDHVLLISSGAESFAKAQSATEVPASYFKNINIEKAALSPKIRHTGTVGAVALDRCGNLAAATSTGGTPNKMPGRVGDSPLIGAGTYADNKTCAVSSTGKGEGFIRVALAHEMSSLIEHKKLSLAAAGKLARKKLSSITYGGFIAVNKEGDALGLATGTEFMVRGYVKEDHKIVVWDKVEQ